MTLTGTELFNAIAEGVENGTAQLMSEQSLNEGSMLTNTFNMEAPVNAVTNTVEEQAPAVSADADTSPGF